MPDAKNQTLPATPRASRLSAGFPVRRLIVGLVVLQVVQGVLGAFYTPLLTPIARNVGMRDADWNLFDSALAAVAALAIPLLTKLGDVIGHRRVLIATTFVVAFSSWLAVVATDFWTLFIAFGLQGFIAVWLPFQLALLRENVPPEEVENRVAKVSSLLTTVFMFGSIVATGLGGTLFTVTGGWDLLQDGLDAGLLPGAIPGFRESLIGVLLIPAIVATIAIPAVILAIPKARERTADAVPDGVGRLGLSGLLALSAIMIGIVVGFGLLKLGGAALVPGWLVIAASVLVIVPFLRWQAKAAVPAIDVAALRDRRRGPYLLAIILLTIVYSTASVPLVTFVTTDRETYGYGLSSDPAMVSVLMLTMILTIIVVASCATRINSPTTRLRLMRIAPLMFVAQHTWFLTMHDSFWQAMVAALLGGLGAGILVPGLTAAVASAAADGRVAADLGISNILSIAGATIGSGIFALALHDTADSTVSAAPLSGYVAVWVICICLSITMTVTLWFARPPAPEPDLPGAHT